MNINLMKYFLQHINGVSIYSRVFIATKTKPGENLTGEIFYQRKIPDLQYVLHNNCFEQFLVVLKGL